MTHFPVCPIRPDKPFLQIKGKFENGHNVSTKVICDKCGFVYGRKKE